MDWRLTPTERELLAPIAAKPGVDIRSQFGVPHRVTLLNEMWLGILEGSEQPGIRRVAMRATSTAKDWREHEVLLRRYVRGLRYVPDPPHLEFLQGAAATLLAGGGDCDDLVIVGCALARSIGLRWCPAIFWAIDNPAVAHAFVVTYERVEGGEPLEVCAWSRVYGTTNELVDFPDGRLEMLIRRPEGWVTLQRGPRGR